MADPPILSYAPDESKLVRIGPFRDLLEAEMAAGRLNDEGIHASVAGAAMAATMGPVYGAAYGGPFVLVGAGDEAAARGVIGSIESLRKARRDAVTPPCPACGQRPSRPVTSVNFWASIGCFAMAKMVPMAVRFFVVAAGLVVLLWPRQQRWRCESCKRRFSAPVPEEMEEAE